MHKSALVLFSGGQDSTTCLAHALSRYERVETVAFDYRQRHSVELDARLQRHAERPQPGHGKCVGGGLLVQQVATEHADVGLGVVHVEVERQRSVDKVLRCRAHAWIVAVHGHPGRLARAVQRRRQRSCRKLLVIGRDMAPADVGRNVAEARRIGVFGVERGRELRRVDQAVGRVIERHQAGTARIRRHRPRLAPGR